MNNTTLQAAAQPPVNDGGLLRASVALAVIAMAAFGFAYSIVGIGAGAALFPQQAQGSLVRDGDKVLGSALVAQPFTGERWFHPRPSAAKYDPMAVAGSNAARSNPALHKRVDEARAEVAKREGVTPEAVPSDLVTQSGGGIDPHISPEAARIQVARVARARGLPEAPVLQMLQQHTEQPTFGLLGAQRVNVLRLNLTLERAAPSRS